MVFFFILSISVLAFIVLLNLFIPHKLPWYRPHLILTPSEIQPIQSIIRERPIIMEGLADPETETNVELENKIIKLENILKEKNRKLEQLERKLKAESANRLEFEKVKLVLDEELIALRKQNNELKKRTGDQNV